MKKLFLQGLGRWIAVGVLACLVSAGFSTGVWAANVALFYDSGYVQTDPFSDAEAYTVSNALVSLGHGVSPFVGTTSNDWASGLSAADVVLIPELENGNLNSALDAAAKTLLAAYVAGGGALIIHGEIDSRDEDLINDIFGTALPLAFASFSSGESSIRTNAQSTCFASGPGTLPGNDGTYPWVTTNLPPDALSIYQFNSGGTDYSFVALLPYGQGRIVHLAYDWFEGAPVGFQDGGWLEVLDLAIKEAVHDLRITDISTGSPIVHVTHTADNGEDYTIEYSDGPLSDAFSWETFASSFAGAYTESAVLGTTHTFTDDFSLATSGGSAPGMRAYRVRTGAPKDVKKIAVFNDNGYVDQDEEAANVVFSLESLGHNVKTFVGTSHEQWLAALKGAEILVMPELEPAGNLPSALTGATLAAVSNFVARGGCLVINGDVSSRDEAFINAIFGYALVNDSSPSASASLTNETGTAFAGGPASLPENSAVSTWLNSSLPTGSVAYYQDDSSADKAWVIGISEDRGSILYLGWDWFNAPPQSAADGGWLEVLERAIEQCCRKTVAVFNDNGYVDQDEEAANVVFNLESMGHNARTFSGTTLQDWTDGLAGADILLVPELENGNLAAALDGATEALVSNFVASGRCLIVQAGSFSQNNRMSDLINTAFGYSVTVGGGYFGLATFADLVSPGATAFLGGPASLPAQNFGDVGALLVSSLPTGSRSFYEQASVSNETWVAEIPAGMGSVFYLGWDWYGAPPQLGFDGGWLEVLERAIEQCCRRTVAVFNDNGYVDQDEEAANVVFSIESLGYNVRTFTGTTLADWNGALGGADVLVVPELENGDLASALDAATEAGIADYVAAGGSMVVHGYQSSRDEAFLNAVFGYSLVDGSQFGGGGSADLVNATGSGFAGGPLTLPPNSAVSTVLLSSLPSGSRSFYERASDPNETWAVEFREGSGRAVYLGWDWFDAPPQGSAAGGWLEVLERALLP